MLTNQRHDQIRQALTADGSVVASALAARFGVSEDTIRRDLRDLARDGACQRVYGGAVAPLAGPITHRSGKDAEEKAALALVAMRLLQPRQTVFIDAGSTNLAITRAIPPDLPLTIATNALAIATALAGHSHITLILLGGRFDPHSGGCSGSSTLQDIAQISADLFFLGTCGIDPVRGATAFDAAEAEVKRAMATGSAAIAVAATTRKLGTHAPFRVAPPDAIRHLIVPKTAPADLLAAFRAAGSTVHPA